MGFEDGGGQDSVGPAVVDPTLRQRADEQASRPGGPDPEALSSEEAGRLLHELRVRQVELEMQNAELRRTQEVLEASRARYFDLYDLAPVGYFTISEQGLILEANLTAATMLGVPRDALVKQPLTRSIVPEDEDIYYLHRKRLLETGALQVCELRMARQHSPVSQFWARLESIVLQDPESGAPMCRVTMSDITERKWAERAVRELAQDLGSRVKELNCLYGISNLVEIPGITLEEILQGTVDLIPLAWQYPGVCCARIVLDGQEYCTENFQESTWQQSANIDVYGERSGTVYVGYLQEMPQSDEGCFSNQERDLIKAIAERMGKITERVRSEQQQRQQRELLETVLDSLTHPFYVINAQSHTVEMANSAAYTGEWPRDITCYALTHGNDRPCEGPVHPCPLREVTRTKKPVVVEHVHLGKDGRRQYVEVHGFPITDSEGDVVQIIEYTLDVTERSHAEMALRESESRWRSLTQTSPDHILMLDTDLTIKFANSASPGLTVDDLIGTPLYSLVDDARQAEIKAILENVLRTGASARYETVYHSPDGGDIYYESYVAPQTLPHTEQVVGLTLSARDITERKRAEADLRQARDELELRVKERTAELLELNRLLRVEIAERQHVEEDLRASEERFRQLAEHINYVFWIADLADNQLLYISPAYEDLWGQARQTLYEQPTSFLEAVHPEDRNRLAVAMERGSRQEQVEQFRVVRPDGTLLWVRVHVFPVRDKHGRVYRLGGIAEDISEQVESVQLLERRVEERTRQLSTLLQIARSMTLTLELGPLLDVILDGLNDVAVYDSATIYELEGEHLIALAHRGRSLPEEGGQGAIRLVESSIAQRIVADREPILISDIRGRTDDALLASLSNWACCGMAAPLAVRQKVVGLLVVYSSLPHSYSWQQAGLLLALANQAAVGIENAQLYKQARALAVIEERQRLARDLHDAVSQTLFSANIIAEALPRIWDRDPESVRRRLPQLHRLTSGALAEMRTLLLELRPTALVDVELGELLQLAVDAFSGRTRTVLSLALVGQRRLPAEVQVALYRMAQEALNNVAKHARATEATIHLHNEPDRVELRIRDNGQGFDPSRVPPGCMGLSILRERARTIGATLQVSSQPGDGTEIVIVWTEMP
jgi:PAS domain S-box-containing protein